MILYKVLRHTLASIQVIRAAVQCDGKRPPFIARAGGVSLEGIQSPPEAVVSSVVVLIEWLEYR